MLQVAELQKELKDRGLDTKGKKDELIKRLQDYLTAQEPGSSDHPTSLSQFPDIMLRSRDIEGQCSR
jgi:hypothetical protein